MCCVGLLALSHRGRTSCCLNAAGPYAVSMWQRTSSTTGMSGSLPGRQGLFHPRSPHPHSGARGERDGLTLVFMCRLIEHGQRLLLALAIPSKLQDAGWHNQNRSSGRWHSPGGGTAQSRRRLPKAQGSPAYSHTRSSIGALTENDAAKSCVGAWGVCCAACSARERGAAM